MVQFRPPKLEYNLNRDYWKLKNRDEQSVEEAVKEIDATIYDMPCFRVRSAAIQQERGIVVYDQCDIAALEVFLRNRGIKFIDRERFDQLREERDKGVQRVSLFKFLKTLEVSSELRYPMDLVRYCGLKRQMVRLLEEADEEATFDKFVDLPPELRNRVYEYHLASFGDVDSYMDEPPITRANHQLREETLKMFQSLCLPAWSFDHKLNSHRGGSIFSTTIPFKTRSKKFGQDNVGLKFALRASLVRSKKKGMVFNCRWLVEINPEGGYLVSNDHHQVLNEQEHHQCHARYLKYICSEMSRLIFPDLLRNAEVKDGKVALPDWSAQDWAWGWKTFCDVVQHGVCDCKFLQKSAARQILWADLDANYRNGDDAGSEDDFDDSEVESLDGQT